MKKVIDCLVLFFECLIVIFALYLFIDGYLLIRSVK